jgi:hypothetical protein
MVVKLVRVLTHPTLGVVAAMDIKRVTIHSTKYIDEVIVGENSCNGENSCTTHINQVRTNGGTVVIGKNSW